MHSVRVSDSYEPGEWVRLLGGPYRYFSAVVIDPLSHDGTVLVNVNVFGQDDRVRIASSELMKIPGPGG